MSRTVGRYWEEGDYRQDANQTDLVRCGIGISNTIRLERLPGVDIGPDIQKSVKHKGGGITFAGRETNAHLSVVRR